MNNNLNQAPRKRELHITSKKGLTIQDLILVGVLLAAGIVLKTTVGAFINLGGMKPNFIIAMYCLAIVLIRPKIYEGAIIGIVAGIICQVLPGTPWLNLASELIGATAMTMLIIIPMRIKKFDFNPAVSTFISTVLSGLSFMLLLIYALRATSENLYFYIPIILSTAAINTVIVQALYIPLKMALKRD